MVAKKKSNIEKLPDTKKELSAETEAMVESIIKGTIKDREGSKAHEYFLFRFFGHNIRSASKLSGYHPGSGSRLEARYRDDALFRAEIDRIAAPAAGQYQTWSRLRLPKVAQIEDGAMKKMLAEPELAIKHPKLLRDLKQASGIDLGGEGARPAPQTVNIQVIQKNVSDSIKQCLGEVVEDEIVELKLED